jgi:DNA repair protein RecO (recombination protein O)
VSRVTLVPAYVLHRRAYRNTSWIVEFFTEPHGRIAAVARSARGPTSRYRGKLELFYPMLISWVGQGELKTLGTVEFDRAPIALSDQALLCGFYLNEVLMRVLQRDDACATIFALYDHALNQLARSDALSVTLRCFEKNLLQALGFGLPLSVACDTRDAIQPDRYYRYLPERGFSLTARDDPQQTVFSGNTLLALHHERFEDVATLKASKRLMRLVLARYLGEKPLKSRELLSPSEDGCRIKRYV